MAPASWKLTNLGACGCCLETVDLETCFCGELFNDGIDGISSCVSSVLTMPSLTLSRLRLRAHCFHKEKMNTIAVA